MRYGVGLVGLVALAAAGWGAAPPAKPRALTAAEEKEVAALVARRGRLAAAGEFEQAAKLAQQIAAYRRQRQGAGHRQAIDARFEAQSWRRLAVVPLKDRAEVVRGRALDAEGMGLVNLGHYREAEKPLRQALVIRETALGLGHPETAVSTNNVALCLHSQGKVAEALPLYRKALDICLKALGEDHPHTAGSYNNVASCLQGQGKAGEALPLHRKALDISRKVLGERHPVTAISHDNVAFCLQDQGKAAEALPLYRKALAIREEALGERHPDTAQSYNNVAYCLRGLGRPSEAVPLHRKALAIREKALPEDHPDTAVSHNNLASCLQDLGRPSEAVALHRKALAIRLKALGEQHPHTAHSYNNVASCLEDLGKAAEALPLHRKALTIFQRALGERHPDTAQSYNNVAGCLHSQGKAAEALPLYRKALGIRLKALGENHPDTAGSYNNVAFCLQDQGKVEEALPLYRKALDICQEALGGQHTRTALSYNNVASCLQEQGKAAEALPLFRKALAIRLKALGERHRDTAQTYNNVAVCLWRQDERGGAARLWQRSLPAQEAARLHLAPTGFDRAQAASDRLSPHAGLAVALARLGQPGNAFRHAEASLARGLLDDLSALPGGEAARARGLRARLAALEPALASLAGREKLNAEQVAQYQQTQREHGRLSGELSELLSAASARHLLPLSRIQQSIPADAALVLWIDVDALNERWGCVVRRDGKPIWQPIKGSGKGGAWTDDDETLPDRLHRALLDPASPDAQRQKLLVAFRAQRLDPLRPHLKATKALPEARHLFVVPAGALGRVPADLLDDTFAVRYVPSGSVLARLTERHRKVDGSSLLAVGDPAFDRAPPPAPPDSGVMVKGVLPGTHAAKAGLRPGDVLLSIGGAKLGSFGDLDGALSSLPARAEVWREGKPFATRLQGSPLGAAFDQRSARAAVRARRRDQERVAQRGTGHKRLPGTRREVESIAPLVKGSTTLLGSDASEQRLDALREQGKLKKYRLIHLASHGEADERMPGRSALILAQDRLPSPLEQANAERHVYDGRLTVSRIRGHWELDADLVVLSACETALGKDAGGDGLLGFAQAFLSKGARSVMLSRWKVDDTATALLMVRFYENLLGKREGLKKPLGRAASLDEAKRWLRDLPRKEAERLATLHSGGVLRGSEGVAKAPSKAKPVQLKGDRPYAHPFYWAAFTLVGDPD